jgi:hypothetical protein
VRSLWNSQWPLAAARLVRTALASVAGRPSPSQSPKTPRDAKTAPMPLVVPVSTAPVAMAAVETQCRTRVVSNPCLEYLNLLRQSFGEGEMLWKNVYSTYCRLADERGWPMQSEKALSQGLTALGCTSVQRDLRSKGQGRPRVLMWTARAKPEPLRLVA